MILILEGTIPFWEGTTQSDHIGIAKIGSLAEPAMSRIRGRKPNVILIMTEDERTMADVFADNGYVTGMMGKWHLGDNAPHRPQDRGFQDVVWHRCGGIGQVSDYWGNDYFDDTYERNGELEKFEGYCTDIWFAESLRFIKENRDRPSFLYLLLNAPHSPYIVDEKWSEPYQDGDHGANTNFLGMIANVDYNLGIRNNVNG